jgi:hypothetical protein
VKACRTSNGYIRRLEIPANMPRER